MAWQRALVVRLTVMFASTGLMMAARIKLNKGDVVVNDWSTNPSLKMEDFAPRLMTKLYYNVLHAKLLVWPQHLACDYACKSIPVIESVRVPYPCSNPFPNPTPNALTSTRHR
jgi:hypothetical protein